MGDLPLGFWAKGSFENINSYFLTHPDRFSVHVMGKWNTRAVRQLNYPVDSSSIKQVRLGKHKDHFRIVFDLVKGQKMTPELKPDREGISIFIPRP